MVRAIGLLVCLALCPAAGATDNHARSEGCPATLANQLAETGTATQLVTVVAARRSSTRGMLQAWRKSGDCWVSVAGPWTAWLGQRGVSPTKREGDRTTPSGAFPFNRNMLSVGKFVIYVVDETTGSLAAMNGPSISCGCKVGRASNLSGSAGFNT